MGIDKSKWTSNDYEKFYLGQKNNIFEEGRKQGAIKVLRVMRHQMKHLEDKKILTNEMNKLIKKAK